MQRLRGTSRRKGATRRAMEAIEAGDANLVNQLSSRGGSIATMETVIEAMDDVDTFGGSAIAAVRGKACSAAGGMYLFGNERWMEKGSSVLIHGRSMNGDNERQLRGRAVHDIEQIYQPQFRKITNGNGQQAHIESIIRAAEMDPTNHRIEFVLGEQDLLRTGVATDVFPDGRAMWDALHTRTRIGKVLGGSQKQSNHPLKQFYLEPPAVPGDRPSRQPVEQCNIAAQASEAPRLRAETHSGVQARPYGRGISLMRHRKAAAEPGVAGGHFALRASRLHPHSSTGLRPWPPAEPGEDL